MTEAKIGQIVLSLAGRDKGRIMIVSSVLDSQHVAVVDGKYRKMRSPKKKKLKHLQLTKKIAGNFVKKVQDGETPTDEEVKKFLAKM